MANEKRREVVDRRTAYRKLNWARPLVHSMWGTTKQICLFLCPKRIKIVVSVLLYTQRKIDTVAIVDDTKNRVSRILVNL